MYSRVHAQLISWSGPTNAPSEPQNTFIQTAGPRIPRSYGNPDEQERTLRHLVAFAPSANGRQPRAHDS
jgi:hypothetical protein